MKHFLIMKFAQFKNRQMMKWVNKPIETQNKVLRNLLTKVEKTRFGEDHGLNKNTSYDEFKQLVPIPDYEMIRPYIDRIVAGGEDILFF